GRRVARARHGGARHRLLRRAERRRPGLLAADLLLPRLDRLHVVPLLRRRRVEGAAPSLDARPARRPRELRRGPPGRHLRCARPRIHALSRRARGQAARRAHPGIAARMTTAEKYVTAAYCVVFGIVLLYVVIIALKLQRLERDVDALEEKRHG